MSTKLTKAEHSLLNMAARGEVDVTWGHPVAKALTARGLLKTHRCKPGSTFIGGQTATITPAGRAALQDGKPPHSTNPSCPAHKAYAARMAGSAK